MKVLFAVSNDKMSESIVKQYQKEYKQIISYKNVYYFNAILKELQRDKTYDRVVISEDLEQYANNKNYEDVDNFLFGRLDGISDEASNMNGEDIPIILICSERRTKGSQLLVRLFGIGIYNAIIGMDRSVNEVCRLLNRPRSKKEAKIYYKIDVEDVSYEKNDANDVSEQEIQNILAHYKSLGANEEKYVESFDRIASQYNDMQLRVISKCLPLNVRAVLEAESPKYQEINSYNNKISDQVRVKKKNDQTSGTSEMLLQNSRAPKLSEPVVVPSSIDTSKKRKIVSKIKDVEEEKEPKIKTEEKFDDIILDDIEIDDIPEVEEVPYIPEEEEKEPIVEEPAVEEPVKRKRGRPRKIVEEPQVQVPKRKRGRPRKNAVPIQQEEPATTLPGIEEEENAILPGFDMNPEPIQQTASQEEETILPGFEENDEMEDQYTNVLKNLQEENDYNDNIYHQPTNTYQEQQYAELDMDMILGQGQKLIAFLGTSKNGTSFLVNNVAELLSANGIDTAILDLTQNRNAYYIYTKNEEELRNQSNYIMNQDLKKKMMQKNL